MTIIPSFEPASVISDFGRSTYKHSKYFQSLLEQDVSASEFKTMWSEYLALPNLDHIDLTVMLDKTAKLYKNLHEAGQNDLKNFLLSRQGMIEWFRKAETLMLVFDPPALARSQQAFTEIGILPPNSFQHAWKKQALDIMETFRPRDHTNIVCAFAKRESFPGHDYMDAIFKNANIKEFDKDRFTYFVWACGHLASRPPKDFMQDIWREAECSYDDFDLKYTRIYLTGITTLASVSGESPDTRHVEIFIKKLLALSDGSHSDKSIVHQAALLFDLPQFEQSSLECLDPEGTSRTKNLRSQFAKVSDISMEPPSSDPTFQSNTNISFSYNDKRYIFKADGWPLYLKDFDGNYLPNGRNLLQSNLLEKAEGTGIFRLGFMHEKKLSEQYSEDISPLLQELSDFEPGTYYSTLENGNLVFRPA